MGKVAGQQVYLSEKDGSVPEKLPEVDQPERCRRKSTGRRGYWFANFDKKALNSAEP